MDFASKSGYRVLGIAESFQKEQGSNSILAGIVMRGDFFIDGVAFEKLTVGGLDATTKVLSLFRGLNRPDVRAILLNGCIISWFNIINLNEIFTSTNLPVICVTYQPSEGVEQYINEYFSGNEAEERLALYEQIRERILLKLKTGYEVYVKPVGISERETRSILNTFLHQGKIIEPLRIAKLFAHAIFSQLYEK